MSFRSGFNSDLILNNLRITGKLVLDNADDTANLEADTINCSGLATLDSLEVTGHTDLYTVTAETLAVTGDSQVNNLNILCCKIFIQFTFFTIVTLVEYWHKKIK